MGSLTALRCRAVFAWQNTPLHTLARGDGMKKCLWVLTVVWVLCIFCLPQKTPAPLSIQVKSTSDGSVPLRIFDSQAEVIRILPLEEYVLCALAGEMPAGFEMQALCAQAVACRTYALYLAKNGGCSAHPGADICTDSAHCQAYLSREARAQSWGEQAAQHESTLTRAVELTRGQVLTYDGQLLLALYHANAGGQTADCVSVFAQDLPYLKSVSSSEAPAVREHYFTQAQWAAFFGANAQIQILSRDASGRVAQVRAGDQTMSGAALRTRLSLSSTRFTVTQNTQGVYFSCVGSGHGVGMSQQGANALAKEGFSYEQILSHYYTGSVLTQTDFIPSKSKRLQKNQCRAIMLP